MAKKKKWHTPKIYVLLRGKPEEEVLTVCKYIGAGPGAAWEYCTPGSGYWACSGACFGPSNS